MYVYRFQCYLVAKTLTQVDSHTKSFKGIQDCNETRYDNNNIEPHQAVEDKFMFYFYDYEETKTNNYRLPKQYQLFKKQRIHYPIIKSSELQRIVNDELKMQRICKQQV